MRVHASARRRGMTLAELLVVVTILTIATTLVLPVVVNLTRTRRVTSGAQGLQAMLHGARSLAVANHVTHGLILYRLSEQAAEGPLVQYACLITDRDDTTPAARQQPEFLPKGLEASLLVAGGSPASWPVGRPFVRFRSDGTVEPDPARPAPLRIFLVNAADRSDTMAITVRGSGAIEVSD